MGGGERDLFERFSPANSAEEGRAFFQRRQALFVKTMFFGFVALLVIVAVTLRAGTRATLTLPSGNLLAVTTAALAYIVMFCVFAYVDIAWDSRSTLFLGTCIALCANIARLWEQEHPGAAVSAESPPDEIDSPVSASRAS